MFIDFTHLTLSLVRQEYTMKLLTPMTVKLIMTTKGMTWKKTKKLFISIGILFIDSEFRWFYAIKLFETFHDY